MTTFNVKENPNEKFNELKVSIAEIYTRREKLKKSMELGSISAREGLYLLDKLDKELSLLDSRYKHLWVKQQQKNKS